MQIDTHTIRRLRDALIAGASADSSAQTGDSQGRDASMTRVAPFIETMYLMMMADGEHDEGEKAVIRGAMRTLTRDLLDEADLQELINSFAERLQQQGFEARLQAIGNHICAERSDREIGFTLAAAVALADDKVVAEESSLLASIAEWFGLSSRRSREILQQFDP